MDIHAFSKTYQNRTVLKFPDFSFKPGTIYAVIGANGCGKSTLAKVLSGTIPSDQPQQNVISPDFSIGYLPQKPYAFHMSLLQNIIINASGDHAEAIQRAKSLLSELSLLHLSNKKAVSLSGGETARMALARLLMKDYSILILDEPCAAMDIASTLQAEILIRDYCKRTDSVVLLITHSLGQAIRMSDEVLFFSEGELLEYGASETVLQHPSREETLQYLNFYR